MNTTFASAPVRRARCASFDLYAGIPKALGNFVSDTLVRVDRLDVADSQDLAELARATRCATRSVHQPHRARRHPGANPAARCPPSRPVNVELMQGL